MFFFDNRRLKSWFFPDSIDIPLKPAKPQGQIYAKFSFPGRGSNRWNQRISGSDFAVSSRGKRKVYPYERTKTSIIRRGEPGIRPRDFHSSFYRLWVRVFLTL